MGMNGREAYEEGDICIHIANSLFITSLLKYLKTAHVSKMVKYLLDFNTNLYYVHYSWKKDKETVLI